MIDHDAHNDSVGFAIKKVHTFVELILPHFSLHVLIIVYWTTFPPRSAHNTEGRAHRYNPL